MALLIDTVWMFASALLAHQFAEALCILLAAQTQFLGYLVSCIYKSVNMWYISILQYFLYNIQKLYKARRSVSGLLSVPLCVEARLMVWVAIISLLSSLLVSLWCHKCSRHSGGPGYSGQWPSSEQVLTNRAGARSIIADNNIRMRQRNMSDSLKLIFSTLFWLLDIPD